MKFEVGVKDFLAVLGKANRAIPHRTTLPILQCVVIEADHKKVSLSGSDAQMYIRAFTPAEIQHNGITAVQAHMLIDILRHLDDQTLTFEVDGSNLLIQGDTQRFRLATADPDEHPILDLAEGRDIGAIHGNELKKVLKHVMFSALKDQSRPVLHGVCVTVTHEGVKFRAADGFRLAIEKAQFTELNTEEVETELIIPRSSLTAFRQLIEERDYRFIASKDRFRLMCDDLICVSQLIDATSGYPDLEGLAKTTHETYVTTDRKALLDAVLIARLINPQMVVLEIADSLLNIRNGVTDETAQVATCNIDIEADTEGPYQQIGVSPSYFVEMLHACDEDDVRIGVSGPADMLTLMSESFLHCIMPIKIRRR